MNHLSESPALTQEEMGVLRGEVNPKVTRLWLVLQQLRAILPVSSVRKRPWAFFRLTLPISQVGTLRPQEDKHPLAPDANRVLVTCAACVQWGPRNLCLTSLRLSVTLPHDCSSLCVCGIEPKVPLMPVTYPPPHALPSCKRKKQIPYSERTRPQALWSPSGCGPTLRLSLLVERLSSGSVQELGTDGGMGR